MQEYLEYSDNDILERVDEYSLYCHYLKFEPLIGKKYSSPIRLGDTDPSFAIFERKYGNNFTEFLWKDQAVPFNGPQDIFDLVQILHNLSSRLTAKWKVCSDFNLGGAHDIADGQLVFKEAKYAEPIDIRVRSKPFSQRELLYWKQYNIKLETLNRYNTTSIEMYWLTRTQATPSYPKKNVGFSYRIYDKYQLYFPFAEKKKKFRNNWVDTCIPGFQQLQRTDLCVITKSMKDVMCLSTFGYDTVSPRGENILLPQELLQYLEHRYKRIVTLFDNDGKHKAHCYPYTETHIPIETNQKDPTDYCSFYGVDATQKLLKELLC